MLKCATAAPPVSLAYGMGMRISGRRPSTEGGSMSAYPEGVASSSVASGSAPYGKPAPEFSLPRRGCITEVCWRCNPFGVGKTMDGWM